MNPHEKKKRRTGKEGRKRKRTKMNKKRKDEEIFVDKDPHTTTMQALPYA